MPEEGGLLWQHDGARGSAPERPQPCRLRHSADGPPRPSAPRRQLTHHSFASPKWLEYLLAFIGSLGMEKASEEWTSSRRRQF